VTDKDVLNELSTISVYPSYASRKLSGKLSSRVCSESVRFLSRICNCIAWVISLCLWRLWRPRSLIVELMRYKWVLISFSITRVSISEKLVFLITSFELISYITCFVFIAWSSLVKLLLTIIDPFVNVELLKSNPLKMFWRPIVSLN